MTFTMSYLLNCIISLHIISLANQYVVSSGMFWTVSWKTSYWFNVVLKRLGQQHPCIKYLLQRRHNGRDGVPNYQPHECFIRLFRRKPKKTPKLLVTVLCERNSPVTGDFPAQGPVTRKLASSCYPSVNISSGNCSAVPLQRGHFSLIYS